MRALLKSNQVERQIAVVIDSCPDLLPVVADWGFSDKLAKRIITHCRANGRELSALEVLTDQEMLELQPAYEALPDPADYEQHLSKLLRDLSAEREKTRAGMPVALSWADLEAKQIAEPEQTIQGVAYRGTKVALTGGSKSFKTWTLMDLAYCIAAGLPWLGFSCQQTNVLYLNLELLEFDYRERLRKICHAHGGAAPVGFYSANLRGFLVEPERHTAGIVDFCLAHDIGCIVLDPIYRWHREDESKTEPMIRFLVQLDALASQANCSVVYGAHHTKGSSSGKSKTDLISGSGVFGRDYDAQISLRELEESTESEPLMRIDFSCRSFAPVPSFGVRWHCPLWVRDESLALDLKAPSKPGPKAAEQNTVSAILEVLGDGSLSAGEWRDACEQKLHMRPRTFEDLKRKASDRGLVQPSKVGRQVYYKATVATFAGKTLPLFDQ